MMHKTGLAHQQGVTLMELTVVLIILIALAGLAIPYVGSTGAYAQCTATEASMVAIRNAIVGSYEQPGYYEDMGGLPKNLQGLLAQNYCEGDGSMSKTDCNNAGYTWNTQDDYNPVTRRGWRGPYLNSEINDAYHNKPIELRPQSSATKANVRIVSGGPNNTIDDTAIDDNAASRDDDRVLFLFKPDPDSTYQSCRDLYL